MTIKKIGLLTFPLADNYGGTIQCMALYGFLKSLNYEVVLLKNNFMYPAWKRIVVSILKNIPIQNIGGIRKRHENSIFHIDFIENYFNIRTNDLRNKKDFLNVCDKYDLDCVIVGSDQVWRFDYLDSYYPERYFLDFVPDETRKIAYAPSFGNDSWSGSEGFTNRVKFFLERFHLISTREKSGERICKEIFGVDNVKMVLDPTLLVGEEFYNRFFDNSKKVKEKYLVSYILDSNEFKEKTIDFVRRHKGYGKKLEMSVDSCVEIKDWLWNIKASDYVVTDSFHGMVFSILFGKNFIVIANKGRGVDRFRSLLELVGLEDRLIFEDEKYDYLLEQDIDYEKVFSKIEACREFSRNILIKSLL